MTKLDGATWVRFGVWLVVGLVLYARWGYRNSSLRRAGGGADGGRFERRPGGTPAAPTSERPA
jgi:APA family basic amino acid/polyamine antiporter